MTNSYSFASLPLNYHNEAQFWVGIDRLGPCEGVLPGHQEEAIDLAIHSSNAIERRLGDFGS
jgi:hypothetical protein